MSGMRYLPDIVMLVAGGGTMSLLPAHSLTMAASQTLVNGSDRNCQLGPDVPFLPSSPYRLYKPGWRMNHFRSAMNLSFKTNINT